MYSTTSSRSSMILLLACDMPSINRHGIQSILAFAEKGNITVATDGKQMSPLFASYPKTIKNDVEKALLADKLKMQEFVTDQPHRLLDLNVLSNTKALQNLNTMEELKAAEKKSPKKR